MGYRKKNRLAMTHFFWIGCGRGKKDLRVPK
jgi:hypothetical protein